MNWILCLTLLLGCPMPGPARANPLNQPSLGTACALSDLVLPENGPLIVTRSGRLKSGEYLRPPLGAEARGGVIVLEKLTGVTLDLRGVVLRGAPAETPLDQLAGHGVVIRDCKDVTIQGGKIGGYGGCIVVERSVNVVLDGVQFDGWYGMRLLSTSAAENEADWLWPHENDQGQWLKRYGGAISFTDCIGVSARNCRGRRGQNGILMLRCTEAQVYDNDFSFLSGWGLAMYRTSQCVVSRNRFDYCVRGYSHGVYWRGQDSAGILMFERCSDNVIAYNSATHSGDGIFLFAGRDSVNGLAFERGEKAVGGSDRNLFYGNDLSHAVANGLEATFSDMNRAVANRIHGCHAHGVWGGYSRRMTLFQNSIEGTLGPAITVEHGQDFLIAENVLHGNELGLELYWDEDPELVGGPFGAHFDTSSAGHVVYRNSFADNDSDFVVLRTQGLALLENVFVQNGRELSARAARAMDGSALEGEALNGLFRGVGNWLASGRLDDISVRRAEIDPESPPENLALEQSSAPPATPGSMQAIAAPGGGESLDQGLQTIVMGEWGPWDFRSGDPRPVQRTPGGLLAEAPWRSAWFSWKDGPDPRGDSAALAAWRALAVAPVATKTVSNWSTPHAADPKIAALVGSSHFGLIASAKVPLTAGRYRLSVVSDDGVRVAINGSVVLENWTWHGPTRDTVDLELDAGSHGFELEYFQIDGASALSVDLESLP